MALSRSAPRLLGPLLGLVVLGLTGARVWIAAVYGLSTVNGSPFAETVLMMMAFSTYLVVGVVLVVRRPEHRLGWVLTAVGLLTLVGVVAESYATAALVIRPGLPGGTLAAWIQNWYWFPLLALMFIFVPLLFPTGRPLSPRWNWLYWTSIVLLTVITVMSWLKPTLTVGDGVDRAHVVDNPIGLAAAGDLENSTHGDVLFGLLLAASACGLLSLAMRFRRSRGLERQQMKAFLFASVLMIVMPLTATFGLERYLPETNLFFAVAVALPPTAIGVAVLRYKLYEIDKIISRTLTYAFLTALLVALYMGAVTGLTSLTAERAGDSPLAVAAATLLAAAAFGPARRRIQAVVDRRFNRARYDAGRTVEGFRTHLRDELDLASITASMHHAVDNTVQPARAVVWLRETA